MAVTIANPGALAAFQKYGERMAKKRMQNDWSKWPADVVDILDATCELWLLRAPMQKKQKAFWIQEGRALAEACGEFGIDCLVEYRRDFEAYMRKHNGVAMHTVSGPGSLIKMVRDKARQMREAEQKSSVDYYLDDPYSQYTEH